MITRLVLRNYKSIAACDLRLGPLSILVGRNGAGKSNLLDALAFVSEVVGGSLEHALQRRDGIEGVRRRVPLLLDQVPMLVGTAGGRMVRERPVEHRSAPVGMRLEPTDEVPEIDLFEGLA